MSQQMSQQGGSGSSMKRELSTLSVMFIAVGAMVGSGVFMMTGYGVKRAGAAAILAYLIAAIISIISSLPQIIAVSACPCAGGYYNYISRFLSPTVAYFYQWQRLVGTLSIAPVAMAFGQYVQIVFPNVPTLLSSLLLLAVFCGINLLNVGKVAKFNNIFVSVMIVALISFVAFGAPHIDVSRLNNFMENGTQGVVLAVVLYMSTYGCAPFVANLGSEMKNPRKGVPLAIIGGTFVTAAIYMLVAFTYVTTFDYHANPGAAVGDVAKTFMPTPAFWFLMIGGALLAIMTTMNASIMATARSMWAGARDGVFPKWFAALNRNNVPGRMVVLVTLLIAFPVVSGMSLEYVTYLSSAPSFLFSMLIPISTLFIPKRFPHLYKNSFLPLKRPAHVTLIVVVCGILIYLSGNSFLQLTPKAIVCLLIYYGLVALNLVRVRGQYKKEGKTFGGLKADYDPYWVQEEARLAAEEEKQQAAAN